MIRPTRRSAYLIASGFVFSLAPVFFDESLWWLWLVYNLVVIFLIGADLILSLPARSLSIAVEAPESLFIGASDPLPVTLTAHGERHRRGVLSVELLCDTEGELAPIPPQDRVLPAWVPGEGAIALLENDGGEDGGLKSRLKTPTDTLSGAEASLQLEFQLRPLRRGVIGVPAIWARWRGRMGLVEHLKSFPVDLEISVLPNIRAVRAAALQMTSKNNWINGLKRQKYIGDGSEFESLREYLPGFDHRAIDWRSSARHRRLLVRQFEAERNHRVILAIDTGHLMSQPIEGIPRLDHAINAALLLSYLSLKMGDRVGLFGFSDEMELYVEPLQGVRAFKHLQLQSARLEYHAVETNFTLGLTQLMSRLKRRSIIVVLTDFTDTIGADLMIDNLGQLARRHLVIFAAIKDTEMEEIATAPPSSITDLHRSVLARAFSRDRKVILRELSRRGILCVDAKPSEISVQLLNQYLKVKQRGLL